MPSRLRETIDLLSKAGEAAFAIDSSDRIVFWNKGCEELLEKPAREVLGKFCHDVMGGRDLHGNVYCYRNCPVAHQARESEKEAVHPFILSVRNGKGEERRITVSMFAVSEVRASLSSVVHVIRKDEASPSPLEKKLAEAAAAAPAPRWQMREPAGHPIELTAREREILRCLAEGLPTPGIAKKLFISPVTVRNHIQNILQKLDVHTKLAAVVFAFRNQLI
jgi:DNA-binding CsgD family transcriptional regulator